MGYSKATYPVLRSLLCVLHVYTKVPACHTCTHFHSFGAKDERDERSELCVWLVVLLERINTLSTLDRDRNGDASLIVYPTLWR